MSTGYFDQAAFFRVVAEANFDFIVLSSW